MNTAKNWLCRAAAGVLLGGATLVTPQVQAVVDGITGTLTGNVRAFTLTAEHFNIKLPDGAAIPMWGYNGQYPGPTLIINQGETVQITLTNVSVPLPVSLVFPGHPGVTASGGLAGILTRETCDPATNATCTTGTVTYTFTASQPGTYLYESGSNPELEQEMGLFGTIVVRPAGFDKTVAANRTAYGAGTGTEYDYEYLFVLSEIDPDLHWQVAGGNYAAVDNAAYHDTAWLINGRSGPDTMSPAAVPWLPHQPYNALPRTHPGEKVLMRMVGGGRKSHPFHHHGENSVIIAQDGRLFDDPSTPAADADLSRSDYTILTKPGQTYDAIWRWTGRALGWDVYGTDHDISPHPHGTCIYSDQGVLKDGVKGAPLPGAVADDLVDNETGQPAVSGRYAPGDGFHDATWEWCPNHGRSLADLGLVLPQNQDLTLGGFWSGSPLLGASGNLPPGEGGLNANNAYVFIWHSHKEKELTVNNIYPMGLLTMMFVEPFKDSAGMPIVIPR